MNDKDKLNNDAEESKMGHISEPVISNKQTLSTLQLWQAHLKALNVATDEPEYEVEIIDLTEQTSSTVAVSLPDGQPIG